MLNNISNNENKKRKRKEKEEEENFVSYFHFLKKIKTYTHNNIRSIHIL
jgi:hypothetical protein